MTTHDTGWLSELAGANAGWAWCSTGTPRPRGTRAGRGRRLLRARLAGRDLVAMLVALGAAAFVSVIAPAWVEAAGPWRGRIVDVETREPLEGVVVLGFWERHVSGHPGLPFSIGPMGYWGSEEVITDDDGRFVLPSRLLFDPGIGTHVSGPHLAFFKGGYGGWRFDPTVRWPTLLGAGAAIEMEPLHRPEERVAYVAGLRKNRHGYSRRWLDDGGPGRVVDVPKDRRRRYDAAIDWERALLGLRPRELSGLPVR